MKKNPENQSERDEPFLARWSRRKSIHDQQVQSSPAPRQDQSAQTSTSAVDNPVLPVESDPGEATGTEVVLTDEDMPDLNTLDEKSDYSMFMSKGVSEELRKMALRKLFSGAAFNIRDGLDDYDEDFTSFEGLGDLVTCDMKHQQEMREKRRLEEEQEQLAAGSDQSTIASENIDRLEESPVQTDQDNDSPRRAQQTVDIDSQTDLEEMAGDESGLKDEEDDSSSNA